MQKIVRVGLKTLQSRLNLAYTRIDVVGRLPDKVHTQVRNLSQLECLKHCIQVAVIQQ